VLAVGLLAVATFAGLVVLWPDGDRGAQLSEGLTADTERAEVVAIRSYRCSGFQTDTCRDVTLRLESGIDRGQETKIMLGAGSLDPDLEVGDDLRVARNVLPPGVAPSNAPRYSLVDFERRMPLLWLALIFAALVVAFGRLRGALSLVGLGISLLIVVVFIVPAILEDTSPLAVALVGSLAVMLTTIPLAHGIGPKSLAAMLGTAASLVFVVLLALLFTHLSHLTGLSSEEATILNVNDAGISLEGLLIAGMVIAALGVLDDVTVSQASTVLALRAADPALPFGQLYRRAVDVGRDHVSATVNTLVLAYVGSALPVLLILGSGDVGVLEAVNLEVIAKEIVATLVGSIGLVLAVPVTTALAGLLAVRMSPERLAGVAEAGHPH
jgi:uncharacterized membrane protein